MKANKHLLLWSSLLCLLVLGWAALHENLLQPWRRFQRSFRSQLSAEQTAAVGVHLRQIVVPALGAMDRCVSCHVGMTPGEPSIQGHPVFGSHPPVVHDPAEFGCVTCHGGQGRATTTDAAHGRVPHWPQPMIPRAAAYAGCGTCHTHVEVPNRNRLERGGRLIERLDCLACHSLDGRGGLDRPGRTPVTGPDLSRVGATGYQQTWYSDHLDRHREASAGPWLESFAPIPAGDVNELNVYLRSRVGAPGLVEAKAVFHSLGCRGCHRVSGVGGDDGPDLSRVGEKDPGQLDFSLVPGERSVGAWLAEHFRAPAQIVPGSQMPAMGLSEEEIDLLTFYLLSLRRSAFPDAFWPNDRIRAERFGVREFAADGNTLYSTFCAACHGSDGMGRRYPGTPPFPGAANPDLLALADDRFLAETVRRGRPGRRMPAWAEHEGGLHHSEIDEIVTYLRALGGGVAYEDDHRPNRWIEADGHRGAALYVSACAGCHGGRGEGGEGTALANPVLLATATDTFLVETIRRGRQGTTMEGFGTPSPTRRQLSLDEITAIVALIRSWEVSP